jgi:indole-3-glycerol phosphate synthase
MNPAGLGSALRPILARKEREAAELRCAAATLWAAAAVAPPTRGFVASLQPGSVIAEMKRRSPSGGTLRAELDCAATARGYAAAGAAALSVLTDGPDFGGSLADLVAARESAAIPVLRKDFVVDAVQVAEARVAGADAVLLIVAVLDRAGVETCLAAADRCAIDAVVEVHTAAETDIAVSAGARCIGINNRDLATLHSDTDTFSRLRPLIPSGVVCIAESGMRDAGDVARAISDGADAVLVGEALMRAVEPAALCAEMVVAGRGAVRP